MSERLVLYKRVNISNNDIVCIDEVAVADKRATVRTKTGEWHTADEDDWRKSVLC